MDSVLYDSLKTFREVDVSHRALEEVLRFALRVFLILAVFEIVSGALERNLVILASGFYSAASLAYVGGLLLARQESVRPADERYPYGYGNRAAVLQLVSLCLLGVGGAYLLVLMLENWGATPGEITFGAVLIAPVSLVIAFVACRKCERATRGIDSQETVSLRLVVRGSMVVSSIVLAAIVYAHFFGGGRAALWVPALIVLMTLGLFVRGFYETFCVVTDRTALTQPFGDVFQLAQRAAREADIVDVNTRNVGRLMLIEVRASFPSCATIGQANAIERDIENVLRRRVRRVGQVVVHWE